MRCSQSILFIGWVKKKPELVYGDNGNPIFKATLTMYDTVKMPGGQVKNIRVYAPIRAYGLVAETAMAKLQVGCQIAIRCRMRTPMFTDGAGRNQIRHHFDFEAFDLLRQPGEEMREFPETTADLSDVDYAGDVGVPPEELD